ncbi:uncharacterized protein SPAPADRAFT_58385 [Spathaspora passalidarum NRRL Y-27907]|uniref:Uncharacterized protein n=1 Tax=Spathaspora passalidarum (strain NRRL Y-27907 / 11-Y1) TaxID=619300 RepID=G3AG50_SPAPN|nr:uncharacterized protein SPAPADRAFT_58385 [Spathaspora passalidarum NRRL Y-27907]EGW35189.1 hypothetical protein SPAPADRAFT_58385 [Spathaspora passalidarum NRRL Y-27907]
MDLDYYESLGYNESEEVLIKVKKDILNSLELALWTYENKYDIDEDIIEYCVSSFVIHDYINEKTKDILKIHDPVTLCSYNKIKQSSLNKLLEINNSAVTQVRIGQAAIKYGFKEIFLKLKFRTDVALFNMCTTYETKVFHDIMMEHIYKGEKVTDFLNYGCITYENEEMDDLVKGIEDSMI